MRWIDTHCHLDFPEFDRNREGVLGDCLELGIEGLVMPGVTSQGCDRLLELAKEHDCLYAAPGLHPCFTLQHEQAHIEKLYQQASCSKVVAIGEIGLDFYIDEPDVDSQYLFFEAQIEIARDLKKPLILHVRKAHDQVAKLLKERRFHNGGIIHAFSGSEQQVMRYLDMGFVPGVGGAVTFDRAHRLRKIVKSLPDDGFVMETDAPDMPPAFEKGASNTPLNLPRIASVVAELRKQSVEEIAEMTTKRAQEIFRIQEIACDG